MPSSSLNPIDALMNVLHGVAHPYQQAQQFQNQYQRLVGDGIQGGIMGQQPESDADRLARMLVYGHDPNQQKFLTLLKQLGYLSHQAQ